MKEKLKQLFNSKYTFACVIIVVGIYWYFTGNYHSDLLNKNSKVTIGLVTKITKTKAYFKFKNGSETVSTATEIYTGHNYYTGKLNRHLDAGDKIIVQYSPENTNFFEIINPEKYGINLDSVYYGWNINIEPDSVHFWDYN
uniref:hypothetical protein n=1 Tax=Fulvivirga sp. TaxID=1931237 RepID=UPI00404A7E82